MGWTIPRVKPPKDPPPCECPLCKEFAAELQRVSAGLPVPDMTRGPGDDE